MASRSGLGPVHGAYDLNVVPPTPVIPPSDLKEVISLSLVLPNWRYSITWYRSPERGGLAAFALIRRTALGDIKILERFPLTEDGWASAWRALVKQDLRSAERVRAQLEIVGLNAKSLSYLPEVTYLGGYAPGTQLIPGQHYDVRFLDDRLAVLPSKQANALVEVLYNDIETVDIGGPGLVTSGGGFIGGGFGLIGAAEGMAIAGLLNSLTTRTRIKTIVRVQGTTCELFVLLTKVEPEPLRIGLSPALGAIRQAHAEQIQSTGDSEGRPASVVDELSRLATMLDRGLLTREEFEDLKGKLITGS